MLNREKILGKIKKENIAYGTSKDLEKIKEEKSIYEKLFGKWKSLI